MVARARVSRLAGPRPEPGCSGGSFASSNVPSAAYGAMGSSAWLVGRASIRQVARDTARRGTSPNATSSAAEDGVSLEEG